MTMGNRIPDEETAYPERMSNSIKSRRPWCDMLGRITSSGNYLPEVDGLRFVAIGSVLAFHIWYAATQASASYEALAASEHWLLHVAHGARGVHLFFAISGFILGLPFANQFLGSGARVRVGRYFHRRLTRLEPPYIVALAGIYLLALVLKMPDAADPDFSNSFWLRLFYVHGLVTKGFHSLNGVTWSLEIEVQFYLLAPLIARVFLFPPLVRRTLMLALIGGLPILPTLFPHSGKTIIDFVQFFLVGFLLADLQVTSPPRQSHARMRVLADVIGGLGIFGMASVSERISAIWILPWSILFILFGALRGDTLRKLLSFPLFTIIGGMCYSIYLIHYPLMSFVAHKLPLTGLGQWQSSLLHATVSLPILAVASLGFFLLIERPCMNPAWPGQLSTTIRRRLSRLRKCRNVGKVKPS